MTLLFVDGFDHYVTSEGDGKYQTFSGGSIGSGNGRYNGGNAMIGTSTVGPVFYRDDTSYRELIIGFALKPSSTSNSAIAQFLDSNDNLLIQIDLDYTGNLDQSLRVDVGSINYIETLRGSVPHGKWSYIEWRVKFGWYDGEIELRINGEVVGLVTGVQTIASSTDAPYANAFKIMRQTFDDLYFLSVDGDNNNDFLGDIVIESQFPSANGTPVQWQRFGAASNYECVNENPSDDDTTYVTTNSLGLSDLYDLTSLANATGTVHGIQMTGKCRRDAAEARDVSLYAKSGSSETDTTSLVHAVTPTYAFYETITEVNPDTSVAWTISEFNSGEFGIRLR